MMKILDRSIRFRTPYNYDHVAERKESNMVLDPETGEVKPMPSCTVPDQTVSIREIVDRTQKGQIISGALKAVYNPEDVLPDPRSMDFVERKHALELAEKQLIELEARKKGVNAAKAAKKAKEVNELAAMRAELKAMREAKNTNPT